MTELHPFSINPIADRTILAETKLFITVLQGGCDNGSSYGISIAVVLFDMMPEYCPKQLCDDIFVPATWAVRRGNLTFGKSDQVQHKPGRTATEYG